jgi:hypothetical protein
MDFWQAMDLAIGDLVRNAATGERCIVVSENWTPIDKGKIVDDSEPWEIVDRVIKRAAM